jgi:hypothetical protein
MKDIKNYLHFYLGCEVEVRKKDRDKKWLRGFISEISRGSNHGDWIEVNFNKVVTILNQEWEERSSNFHNYFIGYDEIKPILRPLTEMTDEEMDEMGQYAVKAYTIESEAQAGEYIGQSALYLLSKHFDLFGLIEAGLAIEKTQ